MINPYTDKAGMNLGLAIAMFALWRESFEKLEFTSILFLIPMMIFLAMVVMYLILGARYRKDQKLKQIHRAT